MAMKVPIPISFFSSYKLMTINGKDRDICIVIDVREFDVSTVVEKLHFRQNCPYEIF